MTAPLATPSGSALGCAAADFAAFPTGSIAVVSRGTCTFRIKTTTAKPRNTVRLAWWSAEESGLIGSTRYVASLSQASSTASRSTDLSSLGVGTASSLR
ncbi:MAG TPA: PA domain-containing protein [Egibacteraceae bacterium]|nr:PA domain-containing protein [Egibacteraceae bacterium]